MPPIAARKSAGRSGPVRLELDKLGVVIALITAYAVLLSPFATFRANRIVPGEGRVVLEALPPSAGLVLIAAAIGVAAMALMRLRPALRLAASLSGLAVAILCAGLSASYLTPPDDSFARVSPASGFWLLLFAFALLAADAFTRLRLTPVQRLGCLALVTVAGWLLLASGVLADLSILKEYANRADTFWDEARTHVILAFGSLAAAVLAGIPLGTLCHRLPRVRAPVMNVLNILQTIPSIALFGMLIGPLGWIAANLPGAAAIGVSGIGFAPAFVALFAYSLLPMVANTAVGLAGVPPQANDAARGMGMTSRQRLFGVEFPLALPVILTGIRIVLVQNIGLATIAALIGGGGFGVFVFQGIGQTAMDLVLLGTVPTVVMAFAAAIVLDAAIELTTIADKGRTRDRAKGSAP